MVRVTNEKAAQAEQTAYARATQKAGRMPELNSGAMDKAKRQKG